MTECLFSDMHGGLYRDERCPECGYAPGAEIARGDRLIVDDPHCKPGGVTEEERREALKLFEDRGPIGRVGRNSIPKSHRAEGNNFVD